METATQRFSSAPNPSVAELRTIDVLEDIPEHELQWLASVMHVIDLPAGEIVVQAGDSAEWMVALFSGEMRSEIDVGRTFVMRAGRLGGMLPFSRLRTFPGTTRTTEPSRVAGLHKDLFPELTQRVPVLQARLVGVLADRVRETAAVNQQREKMTALGKLSAGLAHELNNPASAARRAADALRASLRSVRTAALKLDRSGLPQEARVFLAQLECDWDKKIGPQTALDSLERSDREEELSNWLKVHAVGSGWELASTLVDLGCTVATLDDVAGHVNAEFLPDVLLRLTAAFTISRLADQIENSTARISELVSAIKEYSYMDRAPEQEIDIHEGIEITLIMLHHRLKNGVQVMREYDRSLPKIQARGGELNQIWTNLFVNAADAMQDKGKLTIRTLRDGHCVRVEVVDNGPGIPDEIRSRVFEPFFTTKGVGEGTGLGLDIVYRIARNHGGDIAFDSRPGQTRFVVRLPIDGHSGGRTS